MKSTRFLFAAAALTMVINAAARAQQGGQSGYHLVVIDRTNCPGAAVQITQPLSVTSHGRTGYYIVFGRVRQASAEEIAQAARMTAGTAAPERQIPPAFRPAPEPAPMSTFAAPAPAAPPFAPEAASKESDFATDGSGTILACEGWTDKGVIPSRIGGTSVQVIGIG